MKLKELMTFSIGLTVNWVIFAALVLALSGCADKPDQAEEETAATTTETVEVVETTEETTATEPDPVDDTDPTEKPKPPADPPSKPDKPTKPEKPEAPKPPKSKPDPEPQPEPEPAKLTIKYAATTDSGIKFYNGQEWTLSQYEKRAARSVYMVRDEIHQLNEFGESTGLVYTPVSGELVKKISTGYLLCDSFTPQESAALGALPRVHSKIYEYSAGSWSEIGHWYLNQWECKEFQETESGELTVSDQLGRFYALKSNKVVHLSVDSGLLIYAFSASSGTGKFETSQGTTSERWLRNYINNDRQWQKAEGKYYSSLGYVYDPSTGLEEFGNAMEDFRAYPYPVGIQYGNRPTLVSAGVDTENRVIYWVECATGYLIEYRLATNQIRASKMLYNGDGTTTEGQRIAKTLNPILSQGKLYYIYSGQIMALDLGLSSVSVVLAEAGRLLLF